MKSAKQTKRQPKTAARQQSDGVRTVNDLMMSVEMEISELKSGELSEAKARVIAKNRDIQLKAFELILNAAKLEARLRPELGRRVGLKELSAPFPLQ